MSRRQTSGRSQSVRDRLLARARETGRPYEELLQYYAIERFLYRLSISTHRDHFVLKAGLMLLVWDQQLTRPTRDIDLLSHGDPSLAAAMLSEVCDQATGDDGLEFAANSMRVQPITRQAAYEGIRLRFDGHLGTARIPMQVDIAIGDPITPAAESIDYPTLLDFPAPRLKAYPRATLAAEKAETMVRLGEVNSRMQDFFDLWLLSRRYAFDGATLCSAFSRTFAGRGSTVQPSAACLSVEFGAAARKQAQWDSFLRRSRLDAVEDDFGRIVSEIQEFIAPVLRALAGGHTFSASWKPHGPWE